MGKSPYKSPSHVKFPYTPSPSDQDYFQKALTKSDGKTKCSFVNKVTGERCGNNLGLYPHYCWLHTLKIHNLQIKKSQIPKAGNGLWAGDQGFKKGDIIFRYGFPYNKVTEKVYDLICAEGHERCNEYVYCNWNNKSDKRLKKEGDDCWEGLDIRSTVARFSNSAYKSKFRHNAYFEIIRGSPYIIASRNIAPGREIFTDYGPDYF